jgi:glycosyltransferase involved in cell wall biosynthesis
VKISLVIPAFNEERLLGESLSQIKSAAAAFTQRGWEIELIVCDNNSTDRTAEIARAAGAIVVFEPINQIARARNCGALAASGDWLIFVDADSHPSAGLFADVAEQIVSGHCLAGGATIRIDTRDRTARSITWIWNCASRMRGLLAGSFIFCDAAAFRKIICRRRTGTHHAAEKARQGKRQTHRHPAPASAAHVCAQNAPLHQTRTSAVSGPDVYEPGPRPDQSRRRASVV